MTYEQEITQPRNEINKINEEIVLILKQRVEVAKKIAEIKKKYGKQIIDSGREKLVISQARTQGLEQGLNPEGVERIFQEIIKLCVEVEKKI
jgi:chorismate mutase